MQGVAVAVTQYHCQAVCTFCQGQRRGTVTHQAHSVPVCNTRSKLVAVMQNSAKRNRKNHTPTYSIFFCCIFLVFIFLTSFRFSFSVSLLSLELSHSLSTFLPSVILISFTLICFFSFCIFIYADIFSLSLTI